MSAVVVAERSLVCRVAGLEASGRVLTVPRGRDRGRWAPLSADEVVDTLAAAGSGAVVLARPAAVDPDAAALPGLAQILGNEIVRLPADPGRAAWVVGMAAHLDPDDGPGVIRALQAVSGLAEVEGRPGGGPEEAAVAPAVRPAVLLRWARRAWRPCADCGGGGYATAACGRCGGPIRAVAA